MSRLKSAATITLALDHATSEIAIGSKLVIDATTKLPREGFERSWPPLIRMDENIRKKVHGLLGGKQ